MMKTTLQKAGLRENHNIYKKVFRGAIFTLLLIAFLVLLAFTIFIAHKILPNTYVWQDSTTNIDGKGLLVVVENNNSFSYSSGFDDNEVLIKRIISMLWHVNYSELSAKTKEEIVDEYLEDYMGEKIMQEAKSYQKKILLTDEEATYDNFKNELVTLSRDGYTVDIVLDLHGTYNKSWFYNEMVDIDRMRDDLKGEELKIGYVYQTLCYGATLNDMWIDIGAQVANGATGTNFYVLIAPVFFIREMEAGKGFQDAVDSAMQAEVNIYRILSKFQKSLSTYITRDNLDSSKMNFVGNIYYKLGD